MHIMLLRTRLPSASTTRYNPVFQPCCAFVAGCSTTFVCITSVKYLACISPAQQLPGTSAKIT